MAQEKYYKGKPIKDIKASDLTPEEYAAFMKHSIEERKVERLRQMSYGEIKQIITERYGEDPKLTEIPGYLAKVYIEKHAEHEKAIRQENLRVDKALDILEAKRQADRAKAQSVANRTQATVEVGGQIYTPQNSAFEAVKNNISSKKASSATIPGARLSDSGNMVVNRAQRVSSDPNSPNYNERFARYVHNRHVAMKKGDIATIRKIDAAVYNEFGLTWSDKTDTPVRNTNGARSVDNGTVKTAGNPNKNKTHKPAVKMSKRLLVMFLVAILMTLILACGRGCNSASGAGYVDSGFGFVTKAESTTGFEEFTSAINGSTSAAPETSYEEQLQQAVSLEDLKIDMQGSITMSSKGAVDLANSVTAELNQLCTLIGEKLPNGVDVSHLVSTMFTENGLKTQESKMDPSDQWVGATQVGIEAVEQAITRVEKFYAKAIKQINSESDPAVRASMLADLENNFYIKHFINTKQSSQEIWQQCATDPKFAAAIAQCNKLDYVWRYYGSMSKLSTEVATSRATKMFNAGEGVVIDLEEQGVIRYEDEGQIMTIDLNKCKSLTKKQKEAMSYLAKVESGAQIVKACLASGRLDSIYKELDKNNDYIGPNENSDPSNFMHYKVIDDFDFAEVVGLDAYAARQGYSTDLELE
ncbi:MAG: hypothetical protein J6V40_03040 [Clostridia bacterium]|nr:hypothetical protein [Clostridia bacterium]